MLNSKNFRIFALIILFFQIFFHDLSTVNAQPIAASQEFIRQIILKSSSWELLKNKLQQNNFSNLSTLSDYEWKMVLSSGLENNQNQTYSAAGLTNSDLSRTLTDLSLIKSFSTGTDLALTLSNSSLTFNTTNTKTNYNLLGVELTQALWSNSFGAAQRRQLSLDDKYQTYQKLLLYEQAETSLLQSLQLYEQVFTSGQSLNEAKQIFQRYEEMADKIKKKQQYGNTSPGEYAQIQAELEAQRQNLSQQSYEYELSVEQLKVHLALTNLPTPFSSQFDGGLLNQLPSPKSASLSRSLQAQKLKTEVSRLAYEESDSKNAPALDFVARYNASGADSDFNSSFQKVTKGQYPKNYVGLQFTYSFGSDVLSKTTLTKKLDFENEKLNEKTMVDQFNADLKTSLDKILILKKQTETLKTQLTFRKKAAEELQKAYNQGRVDISVFIQALNKSSQTQIDYYKNQLDLATTTWNYYQLNDQLLELFGLTFE